MTLHWDLFCRVIDNFGDIGVAWRLARDLATRGQAVRLWIDDASALCWMAPEGIPPGIEIFDWGEALTVHSSGDVVIETFGCELPEAFIARMAEHRPAPLWLNLEYLSAESYVERSHGLKSPQFSGPGKGLEKQFFYPGFIAKTGGLLREPGLLDRQRKFDADAWLAGQGVSRAPGERVVSLFAYPNGQVPALIELLSPLPTLLLVCPGAVQAQVHTQVHGQGRLRVHGLPYLSQPEFDHLLWASDLNFVRGEDSFVRAQWAGKPFVWQIYEQGDGAHGPKLEAFMARAMLPEDLRSLWRAWNRLGPWPPAPAIDSPLALTHAIRWREQLAAQPDLSTQLLALAGAAHQIG